MATNPIINELSSLSPAAQQALVQAHQIAAPVTAGQSGGPAIQATMARQPVPQDAGPTPAAASITHPMMTSEVPSIGGGQAPQVAHSSLIDHQNELNRVVGSGSGISQIAGKVENSGLGQAHPLLGKILGIGAQGLATLGNVGLDAVAPAVSAALPETDYHHDRLVKQDQRQVAGDEANAEKEAQTQGDQALIPIRAAQAQQAQQNLAASEPVEITPEKAEALGMPELAGERMSPAVLARLSGQHQANTTKESTVADTNKTRSGVAETAADARRDVAQTNTEGRESISDAANKTRVLVAGMHDSTSRANNENSNNHKAGGASVAGNGKVPADVTKRAALAANVTENAGAVDQLLKTRPDIVGAAGGRYTNLQDMIGSDDPAIAELGVRMHNIALASNGAHGIRSAEAIKQTEDELFKNFKRGPEGIHAALNATRGSMQTFLDDEKNFQTTGHRGGTETPSEGGNGAPTEGTTKTNSAGDKIVFKGGKWGPA
jgi:hypothetical protein